MFAIGNVEKVVRHLVRFGSSRADADDLAQETLSIAWKKRAERDADRSLDGWLYGIARNVYRNHVRGARRSPVAPVDDVEAVGAGVAIEVVDAIAVREAVGGLPEPQQDIVILHLLEEYTLKETAELLGIPFETAKDRLARARTALRADFDRAAPSERDRTGKLAKAAAAAVLASLLGAIADSHPAAAATAPAAVASRGVARWLVAVVGAGGIVVGIAVDRIAPSPSPSPSPSRVSVSVSAPSPSPSPAPPPAAPPPPPAATAPVAVAAPIRDPDPRVVDPEVQTIEQARTALAHDRYADALRALMSHERRFPTGQLAEERDVLLVESYLGDGNLRLAHARIDRYKHDHPSGLQTPRILELERELVAREAATQP